MKLFFLSLPFHGMEMSLLNVNDAIVDILENTVHSWEGSFHEDEKISVLYKYMNPVQSYISIISTAISSYLSSFVSFVYLKYQWKIGIYNHLYCQLLQFPCWHFMPLCIFIPFCTFFLLVFIPGESLPLTF